MKKKVVAVTMAVLMTGGLLAGCGSSSSSDTAASTSGDAQTVAAGSTEESSGDDAAAEASAEGKTTITFWHYMSEDKEGQFVKAAVDKFNASQDEIYVEQQYFPRDELMKQYTIGVVSGDLPDIGMVDNPDHNSYASMGVFEDITDLYNNSDDQHFLEGSIGSCYYDGKLYGVPWGNNCLGLFYNVDMLEQAGVEVPTTWSELEDACAKLTTDGVYGLAISAIGNEEGTFQYMPWLLSAGGSVYEMDSDASKESMTYLKGLLDKGYISQECVNWTQADAEKQFASGQAAMMINGPWQFSGLADDAPDLNYAVAQVPKADDGEYASVLGGENIGICTGANVDAAWTFIQWITGKDEGPEICKNIGRLSPRDDVDSDALYEGEPNWQIFAEIMPNAQSRGPSANWPELSQAVYTAQQQVFTGQKDVDTAMDEAAATIAGLDK